MPLEGVRNEEPSECSAAARPFSSTQFTRFLSLGTLLRDVEQTAIMIAETGGAGWDLHLLRDGSAPSVPPGRAVR